MMFYTWLNMFPAFPQFCHLTLEDKEKYDSLVSGYPPISDLSFSTLHIWWNLKGELSVSMLNDNLVIHYNLPFDQKNSGYALIGKKNIDESAKIMFDYFKANNLPVKLLHIPEFVINVLNSKESMVITEEPDYNEYILSSALLSTMEDPSLGRIRRKVARFQREVEDSNIEIKSEDLSSNEVRDKIFEAMLSWEKTHSADNDPGNTEHESMRKSLSHSEELGVKNLTFYIDNKLSAVLMYQVSIDGDYYILNHLKVNYTFPFIFDYVTKVIAERAAENGVPYLNMEMDLGIEGLRNHKMGLRPVDFFKKFTLEPR